MFRQKIKPDCPSSREHSSRLSIYEGITARTIFNLTSGAFMAGFLKYMGATDEINGKILALPVLASLVQLVSPIFIERLDWKIRMITIGCSLHRLLLVAMVFIPLMPVSANTKLWIAAVIYFTSFTAVSFITPAVSNMYMSFVPEKIRGSFFGIRERYVLIISTVISLAMGRILDVFEERGKMYSGYAIMFTALFILTVINTFTFLKMREVRIRPGEKIYSIKDVITVPIFDKTFRKMIVLFLIWNIGIQFGGPFFSVYMVSGLGLSYTFITINIMIHSLTYIITTSIWGKLADRIKWTKVSMITLGILGVTHILWLFVFEGAMMYYIVPILHVFSGIAWGGINIALFSIQFDYTPAAGRTLYLGFNAALSGIIGYLSALLSSSLAGSMEGLRLSFLGIPLGIVQLILSFSGIIILAASLYIFIMIKKKKQVRI